MSLKENDVYNENLLELVDEIAAKFEKAKEEWERAYLKCVEECDKAIKVLEAMKQGRLL